MACRSWVLVFFFTVYSSIIRIAWNPRPLFKNLATPTKSSKDQVLGLTLPTPRIIIKEPFDNQPTTLICVEVDHGTVLSWEDPKTQETKKVYIYSTVLKFRIKCSGTYHTYPLTHRTSTIALHMLNRCLTYNNIIILFPTNGTIAHQFTLSETPQSTPQSYLRLPAIDPRAVFHRVLSLSLPEHTLIRYR